MSVFFSQLTSVLLAGFLFCLSLFTFFFLLARLKPYEKGAKDDEQIEAEAERGEEIAKMKKAVLLRQAARRRNAPDTKQEPPASGPSP